MKKWILWLLVLSLALSMAACGVQSGEATTAADATEMFSEPEETTENSVKNETTSQSSEVLQPLSKKGTIENTVIYDDNGLKITAMGLEYSGYAVEVHLLLENNSDQVLKVISGSLGYHCNQVNGYMIGDGYINSQIPAGKKANETARFASETLQLYGIQEIAEISMGFDIQNENDQNIYTGPLQIKTSLYDTHDWSQDDFTAAVKNPLIQKKYKTKILTLSEDQTYDVNGVQLHSAGILNTPHGTMVFLDLQNSSEAPVYVRRSGLSVNGILVKGDSGTEQINANCRALCYMILEDALDENVWKLCGAEQVKSASLMLGQIDEDGVELAMPMLITTGEEEKLPELPGKEIFNQAGLRISYLGAVDDSSEYSGNAYLILMAENNSGGKIKLDDSYDSLSVNGFMLSGILYPMEIQDGQRGILQIQLWESDLEENDLSGAADITEAEITMEIKKENGEKLSQILKMGG